MIRDTHVKPRLFRDPIHDNIAVAPDSPGGRLWLNLIDCREVQRLRRIRQLALSHLVYHGAEHSRFSHSMGVAWLAHRMLTQLSRVVPIPEDEWLVTLAAGLLHDIGHGPFSHAFESVTEARHEHRTEGLIRDPRSEVHQVLADVDPSFPERVADRACGRGEGVPFLREVVSSQLDADRLDYILRDGHATGVKIGIFDLGRILAMLDVADGHLAVSTGGQQAVEGYLLARHHMYTQVYLHKTSRSAERMLEAALRRAAKLQRGAALEHWPGGALGALLLGEPVDDVAFAEIDDLDVWMALKRWTAEDDPALAALAGGLVHRRVYKTLPLPSDDPARAAEMLSSARSIARVRGFDPEVHVLVDEARDSPYRPFTGLGRTAKAIRLVRPGAAVDDPGLFIEDRSEVVKMLAGLQHQQRLLCVHPDLREHLGRLAR